MKHDRSRRRDVRRHTDPNVICLPGPRPAPPPAFAPPPRVELEIAGCTATGMPIPDDDQLDAELIAHKNIFDAPPRMSRQARRKALRAEKKAARRAATERFLVGAPSLGDAASQVAMHPSMLIAADEIRDEDAALLEEALLAEVDMMMAEPEPAEPEMADAVEEEALALETIAQIISATGPLIVPSVDIAGQPADNDMPTVLELAPLASLQEICQDRTSEPDEKPMATAAMSPAPQTEIATSSEPVPRSPDRGHDDAAAAPSRAGAGPAVMADAAHALAWPPAQCARPRAGARPASGTALRTCRRVAAAGPDDRRRGIASAPAKAGVQGQAMHVAALGSCLRRSTDFV